MTTGMMPVVDVKGRSARPYSGHHPLNPEIPDGALAFRMAKEELHCAQVSGLPIDPGRLHTVRAFTAKGQPVCTSGNRVGWERDQAGNKHRAGLSDFRCRKGIRRTQVRTSSMSRLRIAFGRISTVSTPTPVRLALLTSRARATKAATSPRSSPVSL
jgi:hypothetical protein